MLPITLNKTILRTTDNYIKALAKAGIKTVGDFIMHFPRDFDDRTEVLDNFSLINIKEKNTILVKLLSINNQKTSNNKILTKAVLEDKNGFLSEAVWFNRKYLSSQLKKYEGQKIIVSGKVKYAFGKVTFQSPEVETNLSKIGGEIVPIYPELNYIPSKWIANKMQLLKSYFSEIPEILPEEIIKKYNFISRKEAFYKLHFPKNKHDIEIAKYRLAYEELFEINYKALSKKYEGFKNSEGKSPAIKLNADLVKEILSKLDFELTDKQKIVLFQILKDMEKSHAMARLLEGDVGTGKTIVALIACIHVTLAPPNPNMSPPNPPLEGGTEEKPPLTPLGEGGTYNCLKNIGYSVRKLDLKSPGYVFELAKKFRKNLTESEQKLWDILRIKGLNGLKFRRQHPIGRYIADFYSEELKLIIELDGKIHEEKYRKEYDEERNNLLQNYGFNIIRIKNEEILEKNEQEIKDFLLNKINNLTKNIPPFKGGLGGAVNNSPLQRGARGGYKSIQVAFMAPTEILARQHFEGSQNLLMQFGIKSALLVGSTAKKQKDIIKTDLKNGNVDIVFGTHALVQEDVIFDNLGFVIIDEQHRFGVRQREVLEKYKSPHPISPLGGEEQGQINSPLQRGARGGYIIPHSLNMTATPIPRTLALTLYGDQDLSIINEYPKGRKEIFTKVIKNETERKQVENFIRSELEKGRQAFWISPLVEESEKMQSASMVDLANAINTYESLQEIFFPFKVGLLHGKMSAKEKESIMKNFVENKIQILSSTSVVEVGVDVPNSTIMCIEGAERFGLSQLHQFRGRVGRGKYQSYCYLFPTNSKSTDRLKAMERTNNGFELSEIDLEIRGPGEVYGVKQSGVPDLKVAELTDLELISQIREDIEELFNKKEK